VPHRRQTERAIPPNNIDDKTNAIWFITIPEMHHNNVLVAMSFSLLTTDRINLCTKLYRKCHKPEPVGIFYTVWYVNLFDL